VISPKNNAFPAQLLLPAWRTRGLLRNATIGSIYEVALENRMSRLRFIQTSPVYWIG
jgi:hypothetical protein